MLAQSSATSVRGLVERRLEDLGTVNSSANRIADAGSGSACERSLLEENRHPEVDWAHLIAAISTSLLSQSSRVSGQSSMTFLTRNP